LELCASIQVRCWLTVLCSETRPNAKPENVVLLDVKRSELFYFWFNETFLIILRLNIKVGGKKKKEKELQTKMLINNDNGTLAYNVSQLNEVAD
jgi:hypothetical protein